MKRPPRLSTPWGRLTEAARQVPTPHVEVPFGFSARVAALAMSDYLPNFAATVSKGDLLIGGQIIPGEGAHGRAVTQMLLDGAPQRELADAGVGWVVAEGLGTPLDLPVVYRDADLTLYEVGGATPLYLNLAGAKCQWWW